MKFSMTQALTQALSTLASTCWNNEPIFERPIWVPLWNSCGANRLFHRRFWIRLYQNFPATWAPSGRPWTATMCWRSKACGGAGKISTIRKLHGENGVHYNVMHAMPCNPSLMITTPSLTALWRWHSCTSPPLRPRCWQTSARNSRCSYRDSN